MGWTDDLEAPDVYDDGTFVARRKRWNLHGADIADNPTADRLELYFGGSGDTKESVRLCPVAALPGYTFNATAGTITGAAPGALPNLDGVAPLVNNRLLLTGVATTSDVHNGLYDITVLGTGATAYVLTRARDANESAEVTPGMTVYVEEGDECEGTYWHCTNTGTITLNTTPITWSGGLKLDGNILFAHGADRSIWIDIPTVAGPGYSLTISAGEPSGANPAGHLNLNAADGTPKGSVRIGNTDTAAIALGNPIDNTTITQYGTGDVTLLGNLGNAALVFDKALGAISITHETDDVTGGVRPAFSQHAQDSTVAGSTGGDYTTRAGHGVAAHGVWAAQDADGTNRVYINASQNVYLSSDSATYLMAAGAVSLGISNAMFDVRIPDWRWDSTVSAPRIFQQSDDLGHGIVPQNVDLHAQSNTHADTPLGGHMGMSFAIPAAGHLGNLWLGAVAANWQSMEGGIHVSANQDAPTGNPAAGCKFLWSTAAGLNMRDEFGVVTLL